jgi:hypothetical protein
MTQMTQMKTPGREPIEVWLATAGRKAGSDDE